MIKSLYEAATITLEGEVLEEHNRLLKERTRQWNAFYEKELDALEWAKEFMDRYERNNKIRNRI